MHIACADKSLQDRNFRYMVTEYAQDSFLGIQQAASRLKQGYYPDATERGRAYEATANLKFKKTVGWKEVDMQFVDTAGEDIGLLLQSFGKGVYAFNPENITNYDARFLYENVLSSEGFILMCPVTRAMTQSGPLADDKEPDVLPEDPDVNLARLLSCIVKYKQSVGGKPPKGIAVLLSKYDVLKKRCRSAGMDCETVAGRQRFLERYFPSTMTTLQYMDIKNTIYLPVWVFAQQDASEKPINFSDTPGVVEYRVSVDPGSGRPNYSWPHYFELIKWLQDHFAN